MSASFGCTMGNSSAAAMRMSSAIRFRHAGEMPAIDRPPVAMATGGAVVGAAACRAVAFMVDSCACLRLVGSQDTEQARRAEHQHQNQDREDDHIGPANGDVLAAQR